MHPHSHHVQLPHHHVNMSVKNVRKPLLDCGKTKLGRKCIAIIIPLAVIAAVLSFGFKFISGPGDLGHEISGADYFSPYTSLVYPVSGLYCDSYRVTKYSGSPAATLLWDTSLYILNNLPTLSSWYNFSVHPEDQSMITLKPGEFYRWSFIFHAGSRYEINSCVLGESDEAELLIIKGEALFREWVDKQRCSGCTKYDLPLCNLTTEQNLVHSIISKDDEYYFIYFNPTHQISHIQADMSFTKLEYSLNFDEDDIHCKCNAIGENFEYYACSSCSLPLTFNGYILLRTMPTSDYVDINWEDKIYITWSCDSSYSYAYLLLFCLPFMVIVIIVLICSDIIMPCLSRCRRQNSDSNATAGAEQLASFQCSRKVLIAALWFLLVLLMSLISVCIIVAGLTIILAVISFISKAPGIQGISNSKLKLCLLVLSTMLFVISLLCNKLRQWIQTKLRSVATIIRQQRLSRIVQDHQARNTSDTNSSALRANIVAHLRNQIMMVVFVCGVVPLVIISVVAMSATFTFLEAFFPVLATYSSETDSDIFLPGDTQTFSFNSFFCSEYSISSYGNPHLSATLYIVNSDSVVRNHTVTYISSNDSISTEFFATWNFYLHKKSNASIKVCLLEDDPMESIISLDMYQYDSTTLLNAESYAITDNCYGDLWQVPIGNISGNARKYRVVLSTNSIYPIKTHVEIELNHFLYFVPHNIMINGAQTCSVSSYTSDTCTAATPSSAGSMTGIISVHSDQSTINWHETLSVTKTCHYHVATWTVLWLPVLLINVAVFSVVCGAIQVMQYKQIQKNLNKTNTDSEPLLRHNNNYGSNTVTEATDAHDPTGSHSAETSDPMGVVVQIEHPPSAGDTNTSIEARPTFESGSAIQHEPSTATASIESILDSSDGTENIEHNAADTRPIIDTEIEARP